jgi:F-type H+-transporting ATPase subunit gamma
MPANIRILRRRIKSVQSTKKITRAMELIAASRIAKAQAQVAASKPYADEITRVVTAIASSDGVASPLTTERPNPRRAGILVVTSDRGLAGGYNSNALKKAEQLITTLREEGKDAVLFTVGRKALSYFRYRGRVPVASYTGFSEQPSYADAKRAADLAIAAFLAGSEGEFPTPDGESEQGIDELHLVSTRFVSALTQRAVAVRLLPLVVEETDEPRPENLPAYEFEPSAEVVLEALLPRYVESRVYAGLLESAASESASRRRAMKAATDNADDLVKSLTRSVNAARQAEITQEISEIVGGADALAASSHSD